MSCYFCLLNLRSGKCNAVSLYVLCCVFVNLFAICLGVFVILLLNVIELLSVVGVALLDRPCMVFVECVCWAGGPIYILSLHLSKLLYNQTS